MAIRITSVVPPPPPDPKLFWLKRPRMEVCPSRCTPPPLSPVGWPLFPNPSPLRSFPPLLLPTHRHARTRARPRIHPSTSMLDRQRAGGGGGGPSPCPWRQHQPWRRGAAPPPPCSRFPPRCEGASSRPERVKGGSVGESDGHGAGRASVKCRKEAKGLRSRE